MHSGISLLFNISWCMVICRLRHNHFFHLKSLACTSLSSLLQHCLGVTFWSSCKLQEILLLPFTYLISSLIIFMIILWQNCKLFYICCPSLLLNLENKILFLCRLSWPEITSPLWLLTLLSYFTLLNYFINTYSVILFCFL